MTYSTIVDGSQSHMPHQKSDDGMNVTKERKSSSC